MKYLQKEVTECCEATADIMHHNTYKVHDSMYYIIDLYQSLRCCGIAECCRTCCKENDVSTMALGLCQNDVVITIDSNHEVPIGN